MEIKSEIVTQLEYYWSQSNENKLFTIRTLWEANDKHATVWGWCQYISVGKGKVIKREDDDKGKKATSIIHAIPAIYWPTPYIYTSPD